MDATISPPSLRTQHQARTLLYRLTDEALSSFPDGRYRVTWRELLSSIAAGGQHSACKTWEQAAFDFPTSCYCFEQGSLENLINDMHTAVQAVK